MISEQETVFNPRRGNGERITTMKNEKKKVVYAEPPEYIPEDIRRELKLGEFAEPKKDEAKPTPAEYDRWGKTCVKFNSEPETEKN